ncbi:cobalt-precorrin-5B (C(1))-methyltransferase CbiD [Propionispora sp. 2/2-37]|uniref:cobalt-precorrin-5B (C(1))-methyltransferase CbiD n=1 Tax=Propionispora sp. 2/2-37 TaxID=1677858 RepID=UPI0006BB5FC1|nr:cobalt-precorrin-5B (C(1))-methyltransferase CbiD [Propionispora sp. 2/2-37]
MRTGITTGTCAAAAAKAAILAWDGNPVTMVTVISPQGRGIEVPIADSKKTVSGGYAAVIKDAGDDPDITNGVTLICQVEILNDADIQIKAGKGVGVVTKPGLSVNIGEPAINPGPRQMILTAVRDVLPEGHGAVITVSIPEGEGLAERTLNPALGIVGGLSIIGTTGIVEPMSEEAFKNSLAPQISVVRALGHDRIIFVPGKIGQNIALKQGLPEELIVQTSNFIGYMLEAAVRNGMKQVLLFGHLGKIAKVAGGIFHTHNRVADARMETISAYAAASGATRQAVRDLLACATTEAAIPIIRENGLSQVFSLLSERASFRSMRYVFQDLQVGTVIVTLQGEILGMDGMAAELGGKLGWNIK